MKTFPFLQTERLKLRQFTPHDLPLVYKGLSDPKVIEYYGISFDSLEATKEQLIWFEELEKNKTGIWWALEVKATGAFIGACGFNDWKHQDQKAEIGFWLVPEFWGQGLMMEVMTTICKYGFEQMHLHRIEGFVESNNLRCKAGIKKMNFSYEGTMKDCEFKKGKFIDVDIYASINPLH